MRFVAVPEKIRWVGNLLNLNESRNLIETLFPIDRSDTQCPVVYSEYMRWSDEW